MANQYHFLPGDVPFGRKSRGWLARKTCQRALVFVHGFGGDPQDTWMRFPHILPGDPTCTGHDIFFFGYDSLRRQAAYSAAEFGGFLRELFTKPLKLAEAIAPGAVAKRAPDFEYERVTIVCHSLGAIIVRRALLDLASDPAMRRHLGNVRIVLFAPAHLGATDVIELASEALGVLRLKLASLFLKFDWTVLNDLKPGSQTLAALIKDTETEYQTSVAAGDPTFHLVAATVVHAEFDKIIVQGKFFRDPEMTRAPGKGHTSICKPEQGYLDPIKHVVSQL
jgi:pimeloyl-ACP methyl ester carboxylesterase